MSTQTRTPEEIYEEIRETTAVPAARGPARVEQLQREAALWGEIQEIAVRDRRIPMWAMTAAGRARIDCEERADRALRDLPTKEER